MPMSKPFERLFIVTGDPSGDQHAGHVVSAIWSRNPQVDIEAIGGKVLQSLGVPLLADQRKMAKIGVWGMFAGIPYHYQLGKRLLSHLETFKPDAVLLIDYGVFNLWLAKQLKQRGYTVYYYIPPQVWASRPGRIKKIQRNVDRVFCIFPFEELLYKRRGIPVTYVGHPLVSQLPPPADRKAFCVRHGLNPERPIVGIFPGSRKMELSYLLEPMMEAASHLDRRYSREHMVQPQFVLAKATSLDEHFFQQTYNNIYQTVSRMGSVPNITVVSGENHALLSVADAVLLASGTVTLEAALYRTPMVITYRGHWAIYPVFKTLCRIPCIGLPNILTDMDNPPFPECLQGRATGENLADALYPFLLKESPQTRRAQAAFDEIHQFMSHPTAASTQVAEHILGLHEGDHVTNVSATLAESLARTPQEALSLDT
jgi:lipid-A-disaccharide synthase